MTRLRVPFFFGERVPHFGWVYQAQHSYNFRGGLASCGYFSTSHVAVADTMEEVVCPDGDGLSIRARQSISGGDSPAEEGSSQARTAWTVRRDPAENAAMTLPARSSVHLQFFIGKRIARDVIAGRTEARPVRSRPVEDRRGSCPGLSSSTESEVAGRRLLRESTRSLNGGASGPGGKGRDGSRMAAGQSEITGQMRPNAAKCCQMHDAGGHRPEHSEEFCMGESSCLRTEYAQ